NLHAWSRSGEGVEHGSNKQVKGHHGRDRIAGQAKEVLILSPPKYDRTSRLNLRAGEEKACFQTGHDCFNYIVLSHGDTARQEKQVILQPVAHQLRQLVWFVRSYGQ